MNTDIEDLRLLSLDVAATFCTRADEIMDSFERNALDPHEIIVLVYQKSLESLQGDHSVPPKTRALFLKTFSGKYTRWMFDVEFSGPNRLQRDQLTADFVHQVWERIEKSYASMLEANPKVENTPHLRSLRNVGDDETHEVLFKHDELGLATVDDNMIKFIRLL